jgi:peptidoglycan/xylan/chitin deacetylase (PgdA/CDA1 family)
MIAKLCGRLGVSQAGLAIQRAIGNPFVRAINYHDVPPAQAEAFSRQLDLYAEHFECVDAEKLLALQRGEWRSDRPGLILTFDDGLRSHADVVAPLLEARGWVGWFMVPFAFVAAPEEDQSAYAERYKIGHSGFDYGDSRIALSWEDVRRLAGSHVLGCHGLTHRRLADTLGPAELEKEVPGAKALLEAEAGSPVEVFAWIGGEEPSYSRGAAEAIAEAGFRMSFMTNNAPIRPGCDLLQLQRTNIESWDSEEVVRFQLSGILDVLYRGKRNRVNRLTQTSVR